MCVSDDARSEWTNTSPRAAESSPRTPIKESSPQATRLGRKSQSRKFQAAKKAIEELRWSTGPQYRRTVSLSNACAEFDHEDEIKHNYELQHGAASILVQTLSMTDNDGEIRMICAAIEMVFRGSAKYVHLAFDRVKSDMIPLLLRLLKRCENGKVKHASVSILNITKTLLYLSRINELRVYLARQPGMLDAMARVAAILNPEARIIRARIIANLANCNENKVLLFEHEGLLDSILRVGFLDISETARKFASHTLMELTSAPTNQISLARNERLIGTLVKMVLMERTTATKESALIALENLALLKSNRSLLANFKEGILLETLRRALNSGNSDMVRRQATAVLSNLACRETTNRMGHHKGLLSALAVATVKDKSEKVQIRSAVALTKLASHVTIRMECYEEMLDALVVASLSKCSNNISTVIRAKAQNAENRKSMARHPGILDTLADIWANPASGLKDKENAMHTIMHLSNETSNRKVVCNTAILNALVSGASANTPEMEGIQQSAIRTIERLAMDFSNRQHMAKHNGLLAAIAKATEKEAKLEESGMSVDQSFPAKRTLMNLLVAM